MLNIYLILTNNGVEFYNPLNIEVDKKTSEVLSQLFYYNPRTSYKKGSIEKNHEFIREILTQVTTFYNLTQNK